MTSKLCTCSQCVLNTVYDGRGQAVAGKYMSARNKAMHRSQDLKRPVDLETLSDQSNVRFSSPPVELPESGEYSEEDGVFEGLDENENNFHLFFIIIFVSWLHIFCNVSRENCRTAINALFNILNETLKRRSSNRSLLKMPRDPRTLISRAHLDTELVETLCCRTCFHLYPLDISTPLTCEYAPFKNSLPCDEDLFVQKKTHRGLKDHGRFPNPKATIVPYSFNVPRCFFVTQPILVWLTWLLGKPDTEAAINAWADELSRSDGALLDIQHGSNYQGMYWDDSPTPFESSDSDDTDEPFDEHAPLNLALSLFVDWFNPRGNKVSGKVESTGVFALTCMNLPPFLRNKISNVCVAGITPGPYSPNTNTINHLLKPIVDELITLQSGTIIKTHQHPRGRMVKVRLLCLIGDLPATKKVAGFASSSATCYCTWCHAKHDQIDTLKIAAIRRQGETKRTSRKSRDAASENAQTKILKQTGVRWSELNRLTYWNPTKHVVLGIMHNWLEGILQGHWRYRWKFRTAPPSKSSKKRCRQADRSDPPTNKRRRITMDTMVLSATEASATSDGDDEDEDEDILLDGGADSGFFSEEDIVKFRAAMKQVVLPPRLSKLPENLGEERHGKLKAAQWYSLFAFIIPLVISDLYLDNIRHIDIKSNRSKFIMNTAYLMECTHILFAREVTSSNIKRFEDNYRKYGETVSGLFTDVKVQPNHHCALHIPDQMRAWGPLPRVAEFAGERLIGFLQKIKTNDLIDKMNGTMMQHACQLQRLTEKPEYEAMMQENKPTPERKSDKKISLTDPMYEEIFRYLAREDASSICRRDTCPIPKGRKVLHGYAKPLRSIECEGFRVGTMKPMNCVVATINAKRRYGIVKQIYTLEDHNQQQRSFIVLSPITNSFPKKLRVPTSRFRYFLYLYKAVVGQVHPDKVLVVAPSDVVSLAAYRYLPSDTFGIQTNGITLVPCDYTALLDISDNE
ncbi:hypothetical protein Pst134EA_033299 [Puccinia striiformis f. sp. tritici]|uniref:hypothetical protein n=2 Tax=Puccinia striiformis f. sp. tritici TaxID=168172 RepID=UPI002007CBF2|nr:hypothetical protein Pst134EA_033299 [Puccinia striiformis f. sp. tritici]KAH9471668.1 hypothetical protein Pst134EA_033299 [Puccinia striiformis f. sp. tritici]